MDAFLEKLKKSFVERFTSLMEDNGDSVTEAARIIGVARNLSQHGYADASCRALIASQKSQMFTTSLLIICWAFLRPSR